MKVILRTIAGIGIYFGGMVPAVLLSEIWQHGTASGPTAYMTGAFVGVVICAIFK